MAGARVNSKPSPTAGTQRAQHRRRLSADDLDARDIPGRRFGGGVNEGALFQILDPLDPVQYRDWVGVWSHTAHREPQSHPSYGMALSPASDRFLGAVAVLSNGSAILPFAVRTVPIGSAAVRDAITPYGYGGAYVDGSVDAEWFWRQWDRWALTSDICGITIRSHLFDDEVLPATGQKVTPLQNIVVDLTQDEERIWDNFEGRVRTDIRRGLKLGVSVAADEKCDGLDEFHRLYLETMASKGADAFYMFSKSSLETLVTSMGGRIALFHAYVDDRLVASEMQLMGTKNAYYFLSGSTDEGRRARANPVMKHEVMRWLKSKGLSRYVLGGGMQAGDSLFRYKRAYSPQGVANFNVCFHESQPGVASNLTRQREVEQPGWRPAQGYVPSYRAPGAEGGGE